MSGKSLGILAILAAILVGVAVYLSNRQPETIEGVDEPLFPGLESDINEVHHITIESAADTVNIVRKNDQWQVEERHDYPASVSQIRQLLIGIAGLRRIEPKTRNPKLYSEIGLRDVKDKDSKATLIEVENDHGGIMAALLVGTQQPDRGDPTRKEYFVRKKGEHQSWLVSGELLLESGPNRWLHPELLNIKTARIQKATVAHGSGQRITVFKHDPQATDFQLADLPKGARVKSTFTVNDIANTLGRLNVDDVFQPRDLMLSRKPSFTATLETFDGLRLTLKAYAHASSKKARYVKLTAGFDPTLASKEAKAGGDAKKTAAYKTPAEVKKEAQDLNTEFRQWIYKLPPFQLNNIDKRRSDLVADETGAKPHASKAPAGGGAPHIRKFSPR